MRTPFPLFFTNERFSGVREKLDAVYGGKADEFGLDTLLADAQAKSLPGEKW
jgi:hypothetical protein